MEVILLINIVKQQIDGTYIHIVGRRKPEKKER